MELRVKKNNEQELPKWLLDKLNGDYLLAKIIYNRGLDSEKKLEEFLNPDSYQPTTPQQFSAMPKVIAKLKSAIKEQRKICVYGDYDVDGITSTAILFSSLRQVGAEVEYYIPNRLQEGYGLNKKRIKKLAQAGVEVLISCDCGISNREEVALAKELNLEVIVTDHHELPSKLPQADAILTPKFLEEEAKAYSLPGAGMAYMLVKKLLSDFNEEELITKLLAFLALAIVADVVPLYSDNRYFLQQGLKVLRQGSWPGIKALAEVIDLDLSNLTAQEIAFQIAPRLNATGRIADASLGVELLLASEKEADALAREINQLNQKRKKISEQMEQEARNMLLKEVDDLNNLSKPIILSNKNWHSGIVGITAGRLKEEFHLPVLIICQGKEKGVLTASGRSISGVHLRDALAEVEDLLLGFGGHEKAAGFSLKEDNLKAFSEQIETILTKKVQQRGHYKEVNVDAELNFKEIDINLHNRLSKLAPFGEGNPVPKFLSTELELLHTRPFSADKHLRLVVSDGEKKQTAIWWRGDKNKLKENKLDLIYTVKINQWQNLKQIQLEVKELLTKTNDLEKEENKELKLKLFDYRNWLETGNELAKLDSVFYFVEGKQKSKFSFSESKLGNRYQVKSCDNLVLLSAPPDLNILKELIYKSGAKNLLLAFSDYEIRTAKEFLKILLGIIKTITYKKDGKTNVEELAARMGVKEETILIALRLLKQKRLISFEIFNFNQILLMKRKQLGNDKRKENNIKKDKQQKKLLQLLKESRAFRKYILRAKIATINQLLS